MTAPTVTLTPQDRDTAMIMRLWDLGLDLDAIAAAAGLTTHRAAGLVHTQLCAVVTASIAAQDARLRLWWAVLKADARNVATGHRTASDVAADHNVPTALVRSLARRAKAAINRSQHRSTTKRGPGLRDGLKGKLITAYEFGYDASDAARLCGVRIPTARRYLAKYSQMTPTEKRAESVRTNAHRWTLAKGVWYDRAEDIEDREKEGSDA